MNSTPANPLLSLGRYGSAACLTVMGVTLAGIAAMNLNKGTEQGFEIIAGLMLYFAVIAAPFLLVRRNAGWFHPLIFTSCFSLLQIFRRIGTYVNGMNDYPGISSNSLTDLNALIWQLLLIQTLATLAYYAGFCFGPAKSRLTVTAPNRSETGRLFGIIACIAVLFALLLRGEGGLGGHLVELGKGRALQAEENPLFGVTVILVNVAMFALLVMLGQSKIRRGIALVCVAAAAVLVMKDTAAGSRSSVVFTLILALMVRSIATRHLSIGLYVTGALVSIAALGALGEVRKGSWKGAQGVEDAIQYLDVTTALEGGITELENRGTALNPVYAIMARVPDQVPYLMGESYLTLLATPIPRFVWPSKPRSTGALVGPVFFNSDAGMPPGPIGEAMWNFGLPGVGLAYFVFGLFHRYLLSWFLRNAGSPVAIAIYCVTLLNLQPDVLSIVNWSQIVIFGLITCLIAGSCRLSRKSVSGGVSVRGPFPNRGVVPHQGG